MNVSNSSKYLITAVFSCPQQLNRWPCHWLTHSLRVLLLLTYKRLVTFRYTSLYFMKKNHKNRNYHLNPVLSASVRILEDWIWWSWVEKSNVRCEWLSTYSMMMKKVGLNEALFTCWHCVFIWRRIVGFVWKIWWILNHDDERWWWWL